MTHYEHDYGGSRDEDANGRHSGSKSSGAGADEGCAYEIVKSAPKPKMREYAKKVLKKFDGESSDSSDDRGKKDKKGKKKGSKHKKRKSSSSDDSSDSSESEDSETEGVPFFMMDATIRSAFEERRRKIKEARKQAKKEKKKEKRRLKREKRRAEKEKRKEEKKRKKEQKRKQKEESSDETQDEQVTVNLVEKEVSVPWDTDQPNNALVPREKV
ncbi:conserved hypothetical protein [Neospora caninum Liverpool]|uniref:Uncharacterized protein n=1 Tax=Neospora caninum (strain Liverpool) TaxID=572307 RepID=F0VEZ5_NEOCL|nr:conserved hypothetical protein [Neospora caninum Liverpool]CBZ52289.1 conserved hypothetical protein [Neospora caninum Liverpool]|eukprot:XP_003882321.1 conserved hypothetical protein [Neospora caninum Liverpool]